MTDSDVQDAGVSANGAEPKRERKPDPDDLALDLEQQWQADRAYFYDQWHFYEDGRWRRLYTPELETDVRDFLRGYRDRGIRVTLSLVREVAGLARGKLFVRDDRLVELVEEKQPYINLRNGLYNLETQQLESHRPDLYFTSQLPFAYTPGATCPNFFKYLETSLTDKSGKPDKKMAVLVGMALAYSMTARTDLKVFFWLVGEKDSGKSTLLRLIINLMGTLHRTLDLGQLGTNRFMLAEIEGRRVVTFSEGDKNHLLPAPIWKVISGGQDEVWSDVKNKEGKSFKPEAKFWWAMNDAPRTTDTSGALVRRLVPILFNRTIPASQQIKGLDEILKAEVPGIFNWLMRCYQRLQDAGDLALPEASLAWKEQYALENDTEALFINECCERDLDLSAWVHSQRLHRIYMDWCKESGFMPKNKNVFAKEMRRLNFENRYVGGYKRWYGLRLNKLYEQQYAHL